MDSKGMDSKGMDSKGTDGRGPGRKGPDSKERWMILLAAGLILLILAWPAGRQKEDRLIRSSRTGTEELGNGAGDSSESSLPGGAESEAVLEETESDAAAYERQIEQRLEAILSQVDGVGRVQVMVVLRASEEKIWHTDQESSYSLTRETDSSGGSRSVESRDISQETVISGQGNAGTVPGGWGEGYDSRETVPTSSGPLLQKELSPEISGVVISAEGGGSPQIQAEISAAVEALFGIPAHRIKILKKKA